MPQGRRKVPFSAKQKKLQLQQKRDRKRNNSGGKGKESHQVKKERQEDKYSSEEDEDIKLEIQKVNLQPKQQSSSKHHPNRYNLHFFKDKDDAEKQKKIAYETIVAIREEELEIGIDNIFLHGSELDFPKRPPWTYSMSRTELEKQENKYFQDYVINIQEKYDIQELSYFEMNLETWRQLWRVLEMSDIILIIVDIRFPPLLFPPSLYTYIKDELKKHVILVLNKIDLAPACLVLAWKQYFKEKFPELYIICFTSYPNVASQNSSKVRKIRSVRLGAQGAKRLLAICQQIVKDSVNLNSWAEKIDEELHATAEISETKISVTEQNSINIYEEQHESIKDGVLTIGCVGYPNVGKSSLINGLMGQKVVSVSRTPGHTKHFQTIFLTPTVKLCDCPGLVFPSLVPKALQILSGSFPIAQVRNPYTAVKYLAERIPIPRILRLKIDSEDITDATSDDNLWSAWDICEAWAKKRGFKTAKAARFDTNRAANGILRMALDGRLCLCLQPPSYNENKEMLNEHPELKEIKNIQEKNTEGSRDENVTPSEENSLDESDDSDSSEKDEENYNSDSSEGNDVKIKAPNKFAALNMD